MNYYDFDSLTFLTRQRPPPPRTLLAAPNLERRHAPTPADGCALETEQIASVIPPR